MTVGQKFVSVSHCAYSERLGRIVVARNYVVYNHELRSHMLRMMYGKFDDLYSDRDRWAVLGLVCTYLDEKPRQLHSYDNWKAVTDGLLEHHDHYGAEMLRVIEEISDILNTKHEPYPH